MLNLFLPQDCLAWDIGHLLGLTSGTTSLMVAELVAVLLCAVIGYLIGSLNFAIIISHKLFRRDIRAYGSKNAGTTNMLRTYGAKYAVLTMVLDMLKGGVAALVGFLLFVSHGAAVAGFFSVMGHMFPLYYRFKGGKGVATTGFLVLMLDVPTFLIMLFVFVGIIALTRFVSLGSIMAAFIYPLALRAFFPDLIVGKGTALFMALLTTALVVFMHRANIKRLMEGKENKISFSKKKKEAEDGDTQA